VVELPASVVVEDRQTRRRLVPVWVNLSMGTSPFELPAESNGRRPTSRCAGEINERAELGSTRDQGES
jgi:hypothetical protein